MSTVREAFFQVATAATPATRYHVSLYRDDRFYGGPEEGGWYGTDTELIASQQVYTRTEANQIKARVDALAKELTRDAEKARNRHLAAEAEWLDARGLDDDFLPQPDGGNYYWVAVEESQGSFVSTGDRAYS